jgi:dTMP kinase
MSENKKGKIITIEGADFSGKRTQTKLLVERLKGENILCETMSFPRYETPTGKIVGGPYLGKPEICNSFFENPALLDPKIACLYFAADRKYALEEINKIIDSGTHLILDRYVESNMAHQGGKAKTEEERIDIMDFIKKLEYGLLELPRPSGVIFLSMPLQVVLQLKNRRLVYEGTKADGHENNDEHLKNAVKVYNILEETDLSWRKIECTSDGTINSLRKPEDIAEEVYKNAIEIIKE